MNFRLLEPDDFYKGFPQLLAQLTEVGDIDEQKYLNMFSRISTNPLHQVYVITKPVLRSVKVVGAGTILFEPKFIHECSYVAHIEDIVVDKNERGQGLGLYLMERLVSKAREFKGCYKVILDCRPELIKFYERVGLKEKERQMVAYL